MDAMSAYYSSENVAKACGLLCLKLDGEESCRAKHGKRLDVLQAMCGVMQDMPPERQLVLTIVCHHNVIRKIEDSRSSFRRMTLVKKSIGRDIGFCACVYPGTSPCTNCPARALQPEPLQRTDPRKQIYPIIPGQ